MTDYISRDAAIEYVKSLVSTMSVCVSKDECIGMKSMQQRAIGAIHDVPAADVAPVVHAEWVLITTRTSIDSPENYTWNCSHCGYRRKHGSNYTEDARKPKGLYCERCGAIMDACGR